MFGVFTFIESLLPPVKAGAWFTVSVKLCDAGVPTPFDAVMVMAYEVLEPAAGMPERTPAAVSVTPLGRAPVSLYVVVFGKVLDAEVTVKEPGVPTVKVVLLALVMAEAWSTVSAKLCVAGEPTPLLA
jgi:hypothetical protein